MQLSKLRNTCGAARCFVARKFVCIAIRNCFALVEEKKKTTWNYARRMRCEASASGSTTRYFMAKIVFVYRPIATVSWKLWRASCVGQLVKKPARQPQPQPQPQQHLQSQIPGLIPRLNGGSALNLPFLWGASSEIENSGPRTFLAWITLWTTPPTRTHSSASKLSYTNREGIAGKAQKAAGTGPMKCTQSFPRSGTESALFI